MNEAGMHGVNNTLAFAKIKEERGGVGGEGEGEAKEGEGEEVWARIRAVDKGVRGAGER